jgi:hypothetical protein
MNGESNQNVNLKKVQETIIPSIGSTALQAPYWTTKGGAGEAAQTINEDGKFEAAMRNEAAKENRNRRG